MTLLQKQQKFAEMVASLLVWLIGHGYKFTFGDAYRSVEEATRLGKTNSLHTKRLAIDLNLFLNGKYLTKTEDYKEAGEYFELIGGTWGGRFEDGNHFSLEHNGVK